MKRRILSTITALALIWSLCPTWAFAAEPEADTGLCPHHPEHTAECGYIAPTEGQPCAHEHTDECYTEETSCVHVHDEGCYSGGILPGEGEDQDESQAEGQGQDGSQTGVQTEGQNEDQEESREPDACAHVCTAENGCITLVLDCQHAHDETCGYIQADPGAPCTYVCNLCPIEDLIAALPRRVTADNAAEVQAQLDEILALYRELTEEEQDQIDLSRCYELQEALDAASVPELLAGNVSAKYREAHWDESSQTVVYEDATENTCTAVTDSGDAVTWDAGWYVVNSNVTISERITVSGDVHLILEDGCALTASQGITVSSGNSLTIYGQTGGTGKLTATGAAGCAGIGGGNGESDRDSGPITIHGGTVTARGGTLDYTSGINCGGAGIGGGCRGNGSGITIYGGAVEAIGGDRGAGIGGGGTDSQGVGAEGSDITIYGGTVKATGGDSAAGIGGGVVGAGSGITINGGTVKATGGTMGAGIGSGKGGTGSDITISGGTVEATGGWFGAGIGGGEGGAGSDITISGGTVTAKGEYGGAGIGGGADLSGNTGTSTGFSTGDDGSAVIFTNSIGDPSDQDSWNGVIFQDSSGHVYGDVTLTEDFEIPSNKTLTIPDGSSLTIPDGKTLTIPAGASVSNEGDLTIDGGELSGGGTLAGGGTFITDLTADMIIVSTGRYYTPGLTATALEGKISISGGSKTILGQTFTVDPSDWTLSVTKVSDLEYTATYTNNSDSSKTVSKTITFLQSGTEFVGNDAVNTYKGEAKTDTFAYGDTITVKATPTATGAAPLMAASLDEPAAGQMAVYYKDVQVSAPSTVADGVHTMTVDTASMGLTEQDLNKGIPLTVKYTASPAMAGANSTVAVTVNAAAKVEKNGATSYVNDLQDAFGMSSGLFDTTRVTLLRDVTLTECVNVTASGFFALDLNGHTITGGDTAFSVGSGIFTIQNTGTAGGITASGNAIEVSGGAVSLGNGCAFSSTGGGCGIFATGGAVRVMGENVMIKKLSMTGGELQVSGESAEIEELSVSGDVSAVLFRGTYKGTPAIQISDGGLLDLLADADGKYRAYFSDSKPIDLTTLQNPKELSGTITVKECTHEGVSDCQPNNNGTHTLTCRACGFTGTAEKCGYIFEGNVGTCQSCKSALTVSVSGTENLIYDGAGKEPGVTVTRDGTALAAGNYTVAYTDNTNAGTAKVTVTIGNSQGTYTGNFTIAKATPAIAWASTKQELTYTGQPAAITAPSVTLVNGETFNGTVNYSYAVSGSSSYTSDLPTNAGTYTINASIAENGNYTAATTEMPLTLTINKSQPTIAFASDYDPSKTYDGQIIANPTASDLTITGADYKDVTFEWSATPKDAGTYTLTASIAETNNTESATATMDVTISPKPVTADSSNVTLQYAAVEYDGTAKTPSVTIKDGSEVIPASEYTVTYSNNVEIGTATVTITDNSDGNYTVSGSATFTITPRSVTGASISVSGQFTYTGAAHTPDPTVTMGGNTLVKDTDYTVSYANNTDAGTASVTITGKGNYTGTKTANFTINPATLTAEGKGIAEGTYGDTLSGLTVEGLTAKLSGNTVGGTWKLSGDTIPDVGDAKEYTATFTPATGVGNYKPLTAQVTLEIAKAAAPAPQTGTLNVQNGYERSYSFDLSQLLPALESGKKFGSVSYALGTVNITGGYYDGGDPATITGNTLTLPVQKVDAEDEDQIGTITVTISCSNFDDVDATIHVYRSNKEPVTIENVSAQNAAYDGKTHTGYTGSPTAGAYTGTFSVTYTGRDGTSYNSTEPPVNAGSYTVTIAVPDENEHFVGSIALDFTIAPKTLAWDTAKLTAAKKYDGTNSAAPVQGELAVSGALSGDTVVFSYTGVTAPAFTSAEAHSENLTLTVTGAALTGADAANYALPGTGPVITAAIHGVVTSEVSGNDELRLEVETGLSTVPDALKNNPELNTPEKIETALRTRVAEVLSNVGEQIVIFDVRLQYKDDSGQWRDVDPDDFPENGVTAILPYPAGTGATGYTFTVQHLISSGDKAGTMETLSYTLTPDGLQCRFTSLSPVAIGYQAETKPVPPPDSGGNHGGGGGGVSTYAVTVAKSEHGTVTSNRTNASSGTTVTLTVTPDSGYVLDTLTVTDSRGNEVKLTAQANGKYTFTMPGRAVTVTAAFAPIPGGAEKPCDGGADCPSRGYTDLGGVGTWYHEAVDYVLRNGLMSGYGGGLFGPNDTLSRAQLAQILYNKEGRPSVSGGSVFTDVPDGTWCADAITWAAQNGIVSGYGNGLFGPNDNITREQLAVMLWRYAGSPAATNKELHFTDADEISGFALEALRWAVENGILNGYGDGRLGPKGQATRAQVAQMLKNYLGGE